MIRRMALTGCLLVACVWCAALVLRTDAAQASAGLADFKPVASVDALMHGQKVFFKDINKHMGKANDPDALHEIEEGAQVLAELANVNRFNSDKPDYRNWATQLRDRALELAEEADKKEMASRARMQGLLQAMRDTCQACHDAYQEQ